MNGTGKRVTGIRRFPAIGRRSVTGRTMTGCDWFSALFIATPGITAAIESLSTATVLARCAGSGPVATGAVAGRFGLLGLAGRKKNI